MEKNDLGEFLSEKYSLGIDMLRIIMEFIPANVFFKDTECKYRMATHVCEHISSGDKNWSIIGKTDLEIQPDPRLAQFYFNDDKEIVRTRTGSHYISEMFFNGEKFYYEITKEPVIDSKGNLLGIVGLVNDITELKRLQENLQTISITDKLTGVYNRTYFEQKLIDLVNTQYSSISLIMCDTNCLKLFNDRWGHHVGDMLLTKTVSLIREVVGDSGEIIRIGGDEFVILCMECAEDKCKELVTALRANEKNHQIMGAPISNSYGYSTLTSGDKDLSKAFLTAEQMMYREKADCKVKYIKRLKAVMDGMASLQS